MRTTTFFHGVFLLCVIFLGSFFLATSVHVFPAPEADSAAHLIPVLNYKAGHGLTGVSWPLTRDFDPTGQHRFLQYPPGFHLIVAGLIRQPTIKAVYLCLAGFAAVSLLIYAGLILQNHLTGDARSRPMWMALACMSLFAVSTWLCLLPSSGRPEALTTPLILLATLCLLRARPAYHAVIAGIFIGLLAATQIANALLAGLLFSTYLSLSLIVNDRPFKRWLATVALAAGVSLVVFAVCLLVSPHPFEETLNGIRYHFIQLQGQRQTWSVFSYFVFPAIRSTFYGPFLVLLLLHFLWWQRRRLNWLSIVNVGVLVITAWYLGVRYPNRSYNLFAFMPVLVAVALRLVADLGSRDRLPAARWQSGLIYSLYFGMFSLMSIGLVRQAALFAVYEKEGVSYEEAHTQLHRLLLASDDPPILFDVGLFPLLDRFDREYQRFSDNLNTLDPTPGPEKPLLIVHQWYGRLDLTPEVPGYQLVWSDFVKLPPPRFLGIKLGNEVPGYAFALYQPLPLSGQQSPAR